MAIILPLLKRAHTPLPTSPLIPRVGRKGGLLKDGGVSMEGLPTVQTGGNLFADHASTRGRNTQLGPISAPAPAPHRSFPRLQPCRSHWPLPHSGLPSPANPRGHKRRADRAWTRKGGTPKPRGKLGLGAQLTLIFTTITKQHLCPSLAT